MYSLLTRYISAEKSRQATIDYYLNKISCLKNAVPVKLLDLGCGAGDSYFYFQKNNPNVEWYGLDIENSPAVMTRKNTSLRFISFDGVNIPFEDNYFDIIYCKQVFEHVRYPEKLLNEVQRVMKQDSFFVGSTSHLEPFHSYSCWNYTPHGFLVLLEDANLKPVEIGASIDSLSLILRRGLGRPSFFNLFWEKESPLNFFISIFGRLLRFNHKKINLIKLLFCGQFIFLAKK